MSSELLCTQCGICCDGTLFSRVPLTPAEAATLTSVGIEVKQRKNKQWALPLGCEALSGCRCTIYESRPGSCRAFKCTLLLALERGETDLPGAMEIVARAKELRRKAVDRELDAYLDQHFMPPKTP